jgi:hypothetical protein
MSAGLIHASGEDARAIVRHQIGRIGDAQHHVMRGWKSAWGKAAGLVATSGRSRA